MVVAHLTSTRIGVDGAGCGSGDLAIEVAALQQLDAAALRRRWRTLVGTRIPADLGRPLMLRVLAYKLQAQRLGDLDRASLRALAAFSVAPEDAVERSHDEGDRDGASPGPIVSRGERGGMPSPAAVGQEARSAVVAPARLARPGTVLVREHAGVLHRVTVLADGFEWNGRTFDSLSRIAFAITGTKWNGPRFFGLRTKSPLEGILQAKTAMQADVPEKVIGRIAARQRARMGSVSPQGAAS